MNWRPFLPIFWRALLLGTAIVAGILLFGAAFQKIPTLAHLDRQAYLALFDWPRFPIVSQLSQPFNYNLLFHVRGLPEDMPTFFYLMIAGVSVYLWFKDRAELGWFLLAVVLGNLFVHLVSVLSGDLIHRTRPFLELNLQVDPRGFEAWRYIPSFPSGHSRDTSLYASLIALFLPRLRWPAILLTLFIMYSRVYQGAHYPSDVIGGGLLGLLAALLIKSTLDRIRATIAASAPSRHGVQW